MVNEVAIEFTQSDGGRLFILLLNSNPSTPQQVIDDHDATHTQTRQTKIEIPAVFFLDCIDKKQIEGIVKPWHHFECLAAFDTHLFTEVCAIQITLGRPNHFLV